MEVPAYGLRGQTGKAKYSTHLEHVVHIVMTAIVWPCWIRYACIMQLICMYIGQLDWTSVLTLVGCHRSRNTGFMATFHFYFLEELSK